MTGVIKYTTLDPNIWRFPEWKVGQPYPAAAYVAVGRKDISGVVSYTYWVARRDVDAFPHDDGITSIAPDSDSEWVANSTKYYTNPWSPVFDTNYANFSSTIAQLAPLYSLLGFDSDVRLLREFDSDSLIRDSEIRADLDSEIHDRKAADSDMRVSNDSDFHTLYSQDSDMLIIINDNDSEIRRMLDSEIHDRKAADSEILVLLRDLDSENKRMHDSDIHDRRAGDSDIRADMDSDKLVEHARHNADSDRLTTFIHRYEERDSDIQVKFVDQDSDIAWLRQHSSTTPGATGYHVGTILAFASTEMPPGFRIADGSIFDPIAYPDLFAMLGNVNILPDLRGQFLRGYSTNNTVDPDGPRAPMSTQDESFKEHSHTYEDIYAGGADGVLDGSNDSALDTVPTRTNTTSTEGGDETRPKNVAVVYGIAMYTGAGIIFDSEIIESLMRIKMRDVDSDLNALYNRTQFHTEDYVPVVDVTAPWTHVTQVDSALFDDIEVMLNGVTVRDYTVSGANFTINFPLRGNIDIVTFRMRR